MTDDELVMTVIQLKRLTDSLLEAASAANAAAQAALAQNARAWDEGYRAGKNNEVEDPAFFTLAINPYRKDTQ